MVIVLAAFGGDGRGGWFVRRLRLWLGDRFGPRGTLIKIALWWSFFTAVAGTAGKEVAEGPAPSAAASLEPSAHSDSAHDASVQESVVRAAPVNATVPIAATLGIAVVGVAGVVRRRVRRGREERRARAR